MVKLCTHTTHKSWAIEVYCVDSALFYYYAYEVHRKKRWHEDVEIPFLFSCFSLISFCLQKPLHLKGSEVTST